MANTAYELLSYYSNLLIIQYNGAVKANATIEALAGMAIMPQSPSIYTVSFSYAPDAGAFVLGFNGLSTASIAYNASAATVQADLQALTGLGSVTVTGSIASQAMVVTMTGLTAPSPPLYLVSSTLVNNNLGSNPLVTEGGDFITTESGGQIDSDVQSVAVYPVVAETDYTLPLAVLNGYNLTGPNTAQGVQLDVLGKYAGVSRSGYGFYGQITLDDTDFLSFILIAIARNNSGSSLAAIQQIIFDFFPGEILVFDYQSMQMDYLISENVGTLQLLELFITQGLLPRPMGVQLGAILYLPNVTNVFGFRTYLLAAYNASPFNTYANYQTNAPWLSYSNAIYAP
jgi:hypothetical protein